MLFLCIDRVTEFIAQSVCLGEYDIEVIDGTREVDKRSKRAHSCFRTLERTSKGRRDLEPEQGLPIKLSVLRGRLAFRSLLP